jgi:hypothetical protein
MNERIKAALIYLAANHPEQHVYNHVVRVLTDDTLDAKQLMVLALVEGSDIPASERDHCIDFLTIITDLTNRKDWKFVLPVARRLLGMQVDGLTPEDIINFCKPHLSTMELLNGLDADVDAIATYFVGIVTELHAIHLSK